LPYKPNKLFSNLCFGQ